jgi:hypothetical protein
MRKLPAILFALFLAAIAGGIPADARDERYGGIAIDTSRIAARGHSPLAANIKPILAAHLRNELGPRIGRGGAPLRVRITKIRLINHSGETSNGGSLGDWNDVLEGEVFVPGRGVVPINVVLSANSGGAWYTTGNEARRVDALLRAFAGWVARAV